MGRIIFHIDMNSFYVSCEVAQNPHLRGKKVAVVPNASNRKSIVLAASYSAKKDGVRAAMHVNEAMRLCSDLVVVDSHHELYEEYSRLFFEYFYSITPLVEPASIDEGFLDVTEVCEQIHPIDLAKKIQKELWENLHLPCSIGIAPNKFLAKMASDMKKPMGITILRKREVKEKLWPLAIENMLGVGKKTLPVLASLNIKTIGDLANYKQIDLLERFLGKNNTAHLMACANGEGSNEIDVNRINEIQSISHSTTFDVDEYDYTKVKYTLKILVNMVGARLKERRLKAQTFSVQIKYHNFKSSSKSKTLENAVNGEDEIYLIAEDLFDELLIDGLGIRLIGVASSKLIPYEESIKQMSIFDAFDKEEKDHAIHSLVKNVNDSLGQNILTIGTKKKPD